MVINMAVRKVNQKDKKNNYILDTVFSLCLTVLGIFIFISLISELTGPLGMFIKECLLGLFGAGGFLIPLLCIYFGIMIILQKHSNMNKFWFFFAFILAFSAFFNVCKFNIPIYEEGAVFSEYFTFLTQTLFNSGLQRASGGVIGGYIAVPLESLCYKLGAGLILFVLMLVAFIFATGINFIKLFTSLKGNSLNPKKEAAVMKKVLKKDIKTMKSDIELLKDKQNKFKIPDFDTENAGKIESVLNNIQQPYTKAAEKSRNKKGTEETQTTTKNKEESDDLLIDFNKKTTDLKPKTEQPVIEAIAIKPATDLIDQKLLDKAVENNKNSVKTPNENNLAVTDILEHEYITPPLELLNFQADVSSENSLEELRQNATKLIEALRSFSVETKVVDISRGPTITRYELQPNAGVKISRITNLADDIALHLAAQGVRIEAPIPGKAAIGIEIPNKIISTVYLKELVGSEEFKNSKSSVSVCLGKDISGNNIVVDIAKMPHLLIAGATGSGKSVCINSILISLLYKSSPDNVKLLLVDPKVVELNIYNGIPHLLIPVVTDPKKAAGALSWAVSEMLNRYKLFADKGVRDFNGYNKGLNETETKLPQIVIIIDELADLMMASPTEVEDSICRLAQMARAAGMHLVIATQRPSVDVITGTIKANVPSRRAFAVSSHIDSRLILDGSGA
ncbi:MAG: segregation ATPase, FtsK/SpoIIIE family, partial [Clostridia bacterium]|nr:segregation ATPase, FtsK/SpoIIIE family [Clostridia bacterium]